MHWFDLPKVTHNEDAVREYERGESRKIVRWMKRLLVVVLPLILLAIWFIFHK